MYVYGFLRKKKKKLNKQIFNNTTIFQSDLTSRVVMIIITGSRAKTNVHIARNMKL